jgi:GcrA cell cycle regulator
MLRIGRPAIRGNTALAHASDIETEAEPELLDNIIPIGQRRTILELNEQTCRWPVGDPGSTEFFFCGGNPLAGLPYCAYHSRVAYQPASDRRRGELFRPFPRKRESSGEILLSKMNRLGPRFRGDERSRIQLALPKRSSSE